MKKKIIVVALCLLCAGALWGCSAFTDTTAPAAPTYQTAKVTTGDIVKTVSGPGVLKFVDPVEQKATADVKIDHVDVKMGDAVKKGDKIAEFDPTMLSADIAKLSGTVTQLKQQRQGLLLSFQSEKTIAAGVKGRIKEIYVKEGDAIETVVAAKGGIALISTDGLMTVQIPGAGLAVNDEVSVKADKDSYKGNVSKIDGDTATVSFPDTKVLQGSSVDVYKGGELLGTGKAQIDLPYLLPADSGVVTKVNAKANAMVGPISPVAHVKYQTTDASYTAVQDQLTQAQSDLDAANALKAQGAILADNDGVVAFVLPEGVYPNGVKLMDLYPQGQFEFNTAVDELDIFNVALGQSATIQFDGIPAKAFDATVSKISSIGQVANGFTTYAVTMAVTDDGTLKSGLNGTAKIVIDQKKGVLYVPVEAVQNDSNGDNVTLADNAQTKVPVKTGISDGHNIEIVSGLSAGDAVVIRKAADITASAQ